MKYNLQDTREYKDIGYPAEIKAREIIKNNENVEIIETCNNYMYDFKDSNNITYEIKNDITSNVTNNFFITYAQTNNKHEEYIPAGISRSIAVYYMILHNNKFYKIKREDILYLIISNPKKQ